MDFPILPAACLFINNASEYLCMHFVFSSLEYIPSSGNLGSCYNSVPLCDESLGCCRTWPHYFAASSKTYRGSNASLFCQNLLLPAVFNYRQPSRSGAPSSYGLAATHRLERPLRSSRLKLCIFPGAQLVCAEGPCGWMKQVVF